MDFTTLVPNDVLVVTFGFYSCDPKSLQLLLVCKRWNDLLKNNERHWKNVCQSTWNKCLERSYKPPSTLQLIQNITCEYAVEQSGFPSWFDFAKLLFLYPKIQHHVLLDKKSRVAHISQVELGPNIRVFAVKTIFVHPHKIVTNCKYLKHTLTKEDIVVEYPDGIIQGGK
jgi:hypothetical protein